MWSPLTMTMTYQCIDQFKMGQKRVINNDIDSNKGVKDSALIKKGMWPMSSSQNVCLLVNAHPST